ncbi:MAG: radical SAM protein [Candidatus Omnitrophica bacterium]|nr:radical SAM protein [Candidatus Omnitrophota bacterium]
MNSVYYNIKSLAYGTKNILLRYINGTLLKPRWLWFEVTDRCNSRCLHCNIWSKKPKKDILAPVEIKKLLSEPLFNDIEWILNAGGEPALRDDLEEVILSQHEAVPKAKIMISTNGLLPERIVSVVKSAIINKINIYVGTSIEAIGKEHDSIRGIAGNFEKVDRLLREPVVIRDTYKNGFPSFGFTLIDRTLPHLEAVKLYLENWEWIS